jgi:tripartite-type tricarboxylate transporter receptor subunit TctC
MLRRKFLNSLFASILFAGVSPAPSATADTLPPGPIHIFVGFGAASVADTLARLVAKDMQEQLGRAVVVEDRPGNSSMAAAEMVARSAADGRTLFMATVANTLNPAKEASGFDLSKNMEAVALLAQVPTLLVAGPGLKVRDIGELVALAKQHPDQLTFGTSGSFTASHMAVEMFNKGAGVKIVAVPYQGGSNQAVTDLLGGRINLMFNAAATLAPFAKDGKVTPLAVAQKSRTPLMPDVPTLEEAGMPDIDAAIWIGLVAPAGTPRDVVDVLSKAANSAIKKPATRDALLLEGLDPLGSTPDQFFEFIRNDITKWKAILASSGLMTTQAK